MRHDGRGAARAALAIFLATELSGGYGLFVPLMLTSAIAFTTSRALMRHSIYARELAERGELLTHDKDRRC